MSLGLEDVVNTTNCFEFFIFLNLLKPLAHLSLAN